MLQHDENKQIKERMRHKLYSYVKKSTTGLQEPQDAQRRGVQVQEER